jgi:hypothetical protein
LILLLAFCAENGKQMLGRLNGKTAIVLGGSRGIGEGVVAVLVREHEPASRFVSTFIGDANLLEGRREQGVVKLGRGASIRSPGTDGEVNVVIRLFRKG